MLLKSFQLKNFLSFDDKSEKIDLNDLNIIIGPNGSGKSNFIEGMALLKAASIDLKSAINKGGGVSEWLWKGKKQPQEACMIASIPNPPYIPFVYELGFTMSGDRFEITHELLKEEKPRNPSESHPYLYYENISGGIPTINVKEFEKKSKTRTLKREDINLEKSILVQRKDPEIYPELYAIADKFSKIMIYRNISTDKNSPIRNAQLLDLPTDTVLEDGSNLALIYNNLNGTNEYKMILEEITQIYEGIEDVVVKMQANRVLLSLRESINNNQTTIPSSRLSDGTLQYLFLLAILFNPAPPPLICLEEPETGLHPDLISNFANVLRKASERTQIIVTTHSKQLIDAFTDTPENVLICEKHDGATTLERLNAEKLKPWLDEYSLGTLWARGDIGGNKW